VGRISRAEAWEALGGRTGFYGRWVDWSPRDRQLVWDQLGTPEKEAIWTLFADKPECLPEPAPVATVANNTGSAPLLGNTGADMPDGMVKESRAARIARNHGVDRASDLLAEELVRGGIEALQKNGTFWLQLEDLDTWIEAQLEIAEAEFEDEMDEEPEFEVAEDEIGELEQQVLTEVEPSGMALGYDLQMIWYAFVIIASIAVIIWAYSGIA
jgi:hypothetical protein